MDGTTLLAAKLQRAVENEESISGRVDLSRLSRRWASSLSEEVASHARRAGLTLTSKNLSDQIDSLLPSLAGTEAWRATVERDITRSLAMFSAIQRDHDAGSVSRVEIGYGDWHQGECASKVHTPNGSFFVKKAYLEAGTPYHPGDISPPLHKEVRFPERSHSGEGGRVYYRNVERDAEPVVPPDAFWWRAGFASAEIDVLGFADCHFENVRVSAGKLYVVDAEVFDRRMTGLSSTLLLQRSGDSPLGLTSGLMSRATKRRSISPHLAADEDGVRVSYRTPVRRSVASDVRSVYGDLGDYVDSFVEGLRYGYRHVASVPKGELIRSGMYTRHVFRSTWRYRASLLLALKIMSEGVSGGEAFYRSARSSLKTQRVRRSVVESEMRQMAAGDVPMFWRRAGTGSVVDPQGVEVDCVEPPRSELDARLADIGLDAYVREQVSYVRSCLDSENRARAH